MTTETDKPVDHVAAALATYDAQEAFRKLPAPSDLAEAEAAWSAVLKWYMAVNASGALEPAKREVYDTMMSARAVLQKFQDAQAAARLSGYDVDDLKALSGDVVEILLDAPPNMLFLPNDHFPDAMAAARIFQHLGAGRELFRRGDAVVELDDKQHVGVVTPIMLQSRLNARGRKVHAFNFDKDKGIYTAPKRCGESQSKVMLATLAVRKLPEIKLVTRAPVLIERDGKLVSTLPGYNADCGVLVLGNTPIPDVAVDVAAAALIDLLRDFKFNCVFRPK